jgi:hypothetical protein
LSPLPAFHLFQVTQDVSAEELKQYLARYEHFVFSGEPQPARRLATELKQNRSTVRTWIKRARMIARLARLEPESLGISDHVQAELM